MVLLYPATECLNFKMQMKIGVDTVESFSLEDLMIFLKEKNIQAAESEMKRERRRSATSTSCSYQVNCHVSKISFRNLLSVVNLEKMMKNRFLNVYKFWREST